MTRIYRETATIKADQFDGSESVELPVIPKQVANFIELYKENYTLADLLMDSVNCLIPIETRWVNRHRDETVRAWLDGYQLEDGK